MLTLFDLLLDVLGAGRIPLKSLRARGEHGGWILGAIVLLGALLLAAIQGFANRAS